MSVSRRSFLVGAGSIITASYLRDAWAFLKDTEKPLLIRPSDPKQDLYAGYFEDVYRLFLGKPQYAPPPPPLWIDHLKSRGCKLDTPQEIKEVCETDGFTLEDLYQPVDGYGWEDMWEHSNSPDAKAYELLHSDKIFPRLSGYEKEGKIVFESYPNPMSSARWVEVHDPLSLSLLQARLNELSLGVAVHELPTGWENSV